MLTPEAVKKVASLTHLELNEEEITLFSSQLSAILDYMDQLNELDTTGVEPLFSPVTHTTVLREDTVCQQFSRDNLLRNAPKSDSRYFIVPKIL